MSYLVHRLLATSAAALPDAVAVVDGSRTLSYRELAGLSDRVARGLVALGVERGDRVGIVLPKSIEAVVAIFAILEAGAVYVPIDPAMPVARARLIITDCAMKALVTTAAKLAKLVDAGGSGVTGAIAIDGPARAPAGAGLQVLDWAALRDSSAPAHVGPAQTEQDLAYILYTSGSTGVPKGVMLSHRAALTFIDWAHDRFAVTAGDRVSSHAPFHFDLSIFDLFVSIKAGAAVVLVPAGLAGFPLSLAAFIAEQRISVWYSVPSVLVRLVLHGDLGERELSSLTRILFAGEVFPIQHLRALMTALPHARYYNLYGPTETNVCTCYEVPALAPDQTRIPIGSACANTDVFVLDEHGSRVPVGELGELCVRGPSVMDGYWGRPDKTKEVLREHPLGPASTAARVYRTGDLVREQPDGDFDYVGRRDNMVKSQGYRIELGEIEAALTSHPAVAEAAVVAIPDDELGNRLHAFVVARAGEDLTLRQVEAHCVTRVPRYMLPHHTELWEELPRTSTGKLDRARLTSVAGER